MSDRTPQQIADQLNSLRAQAVSIVEGTIASAANPGGSITFTYVNPIDGQPYTATGTAFNQCSPSKVSALKLEDGSWIVVGAHESAIVREAVHTDRRAKPKVKKMDKVKVLFSRIEGNERVFYLWGDRPIPKRIFAITKDSYMLIAKINNLGDDKWIVGLQWESTTESVTNYFTQSAVIHTQVFSNSQVWNETIAIGQRNTISSLPSNNNVSPTLSYMGYGFWLVADTGLPTFDLGIRTPTTFIFYEGTVRTLLGSLAYSVPGDGTSDITVTLTVPVSLTETRTSVDRRQAFNNPATELFTGQITAPSLFGDTQGNYQYYADGAGSARQYKLTPNISIPANPFPNDSTDEGFPFSMGYASRIDSGIGGGGQIKGNQYSTVRSLTSGAYYDTTGQWTVDIYDIAQTTTKRSIKTKVTCKLNLSTDFLYSAAYYP